MSQRFGEIRQIAFVVRDINQAMQYWGETLGIGPFFIKRNITFEPFIYRGRVSPSPSVSIALANSGNLQIELIEQHDDVPSIFQEFSSSEGQGLQHVSAWVTREELREKRTELLAQGLLIAQECTIPASGVNLIYFSTENKQGGLIYEISDLAEPEHKARIASIQNAAEVWNGEGVWREVVQ
ncbi:glyoxalase [Oleiphilus messinensis]|uniref:Glyoxalase n=1 Tax=Oleiphilus messinensis TaxID=141451 RepID=A0A1Y0IHA8_9GAMM|nr:VOC family protein [Oleiphilus messinensis]ARU58925.1 glyoxalase [Oleiphilus messinensis]